MARVSLDKTAVQRRNGYLKVTSGRQLYVYGRDTTTPVTLYDAPTAGSTVAQPLESDTEGRYPDVWVEAGSYDLYSPGDALNPTQQWEAIHGMDVADIPDRTADETISGAWTFTDVFKVNHANGNALNIKPSGDTGTAPVNTYSESGSGFGLIHHVMGTGSAGYAIGLGLDIGSGGGVFGSGKNSGNIFKGIAQPSHSGVGLAMDGYSKQNFLSVFKMFKGSFGIAIEGENGEGFTDGVAVSGDATFTSATASFVAGDVGKAITQTTTIGSQASAIPAGTTILSVTNSTTVELSQNAAGSATAINFTIADRAKPTTDYAVRMYDTSDVMIWGVTWDTFTWKKNLVIQGTGSNPSDWFFTSGTMRGYAHNGTTYTRHGLTQDSNGLKLQAYAAAARGLEANPSTALWFQHGTDNGAAKVGFFGVSPVVRPSAFTQTYSTATRTHSNPTASSVATTAATNISPYGYAQAQADAIVTAVNALIVDVANVKQVLNALIDDQQSLGLAQ